METGQNISPSKTGSPSSHGGSPSSPNGTSRERRRERLRRPVGDTDATENGPFSPDSADGAGMEARGSLPRRADRFANDFVKRDSVANVHREAQNGRDYEVRVFQEEPSVKVLGGRSEDAWPTRYVEYDVELKYKNFKWQVEIPKSTVYGLWFFVKSKMHSLTRTSGNSSNTRSEDAAAASASAALYATWNFPQMRKLFLANAEKSVSPEMVALVQQYLDAVVKVPALLHTSYISEMFQVSLSTFDDEEGYTSVREGWLRVRMWLKGNQENVRINRGAVTCDNECFNCMCVVKRVNFKSKKWGWVALKHSSIAVYHSIQDTRASEVFLIDHKFNIERGIQSAGSNTALLVSNSTFVMQLEAKTKQSIVKWANDIRKSAEKSDWSQSHRDESFSIPRNPNRVASYAKWFVDGKDAYESIFEGLQSARKEIFIAGWWICPTIHLLRPAAEFPHSRLDVLLQKKAEEGVKIYILMYKEISVALTLNSNFSKNVFRKLHENVHVLRDPDFLMKQLGMWSHHEKIVSIDQKVTFVGGLDLCFGRWDTPDHFLFDGSAQHTNFVGKDYSNPRVKDFVDVHQPEKDLVDRKIVPRMPWHDCHCRLEGQPARDVARHFIQRWNYSVSTRSKSSKLHHLVPMKGFKPTMIKADKSSCLLTRRLQKAVHAVRAVHGLRKGTLAGGGGKSGDDGADDDAARAADRRKSHSSSPNLSPVRPNLKDFETKPMKTLEGRRSLSKDDLVEHSHRGFNKNRRLSRGLSNMPGEEEEDEEFDTSELEIERELELEMMEKRGFPAAVQVLRSISLWSGGCPTERSIQNAYIRLIGSADHFIYIENQFFVSGMEGDHACSNRIANAIVERIRRAAANKEAFRVMVVMPLMPAFQGKVEEKEASSLRGVMYWQYRSICRGENSIYHTLFKELEDPFEYLAFYGLRTHNTQNGQPETEEVYVHSKVMIVDDRSCIIGSANINERSMNGDRDSEIAVLVDDTELDDSIKIANGTFSVGKFAHSFRMKLFEEHFGVVPGTELYTKYSDPVKVDTWFTMQEHAMKNCQIYESVFGCLPSDNVLSFKQINMFLENVANGTNVASRESVNSPNGLRPGHRRTRGDSAAANGAGGGGGGAAPVSPSNGSTTSQNQNQNQNQQSPPASPRRQEAQRKATKIVEQEDPIEDDQIEPRIDGGQWSHQNTVGSPVSSPYSPSGSSAVDALSPLSESKVVMMERQKSGMLSGAIHLNLREDSQIFKRKEELKEVQGHIVYFPLKFLADEPLEPKLLPAELFQ